MMTIHTAGALRMRLRPPARRTASLAAGGFATTGAAGTAYQLDNGLAHFDFLTDKSGGFSLTTMTRIGGASWTNAETDLFRIIVFDASSTNSLATSIVTPFAGCMGTPVVASGASQSIELTWTNLGVGSTDFLNVTVLLELRSGEDFLRASMAAAWVGTPTRYAVDSLCVLPVRFNGLQRGSDYAVLPAVGGISVQDPITNLRYDPAGGRPTTLFGGNVRNVWKCPSGRGWSMSGGWGYHETTGALGAGEAWHVWNEQWDLQELTVCYQSDGSRMAWECYAPMPDNVIVGNNGRAMAIGGTCLRATRTTSSNAWADFGLHYGARKKAVAPTWYKGKRKTRTDLSAIEKVPFVFLDIAQTGYTGSTAFLSAAMDTVRARLGVTSAVPIFCNGEFPSLNLTHPYEAEIGDARATLATLLAKNVFVSPWAQSSGFDSGSANGSAFGAGPLTWDKYKWSGNDLRWWTNLDVQGSFRQSRRGRLLALGADGLAERSVGAYYRERNYPVTNWNSGTKTATVTGTPSSDGFPSDLTVMVAVLIPASGAARLATAPVFALGSNTIQTSGAFKDGLGATVNPTNSDSIELAVAAVDPGSFCPHATANSAAYKANIDANVGSGKFTNCHICGTYRDVFDSPLWLVRSEYAAGCYRDHTGWSKIDGGYTQHPLGGGNWYLTAMRSYLMSLRASLRATQTAALGFGVTLDNCEDVSEVTHDAFEYCWRIFASGDLWRVMDGVDPGISKVKAVPLYAAAHSGEVFFRAQNHELSSGGMISSVQANTELHRAQAYELASEWVYGMTLPTLSLYASDATGVLDIFDDTKFVSGGGLVENELKGTRDLWLQMNKAQLTWLEGAGFRYGDFLPPPVVDFAGTDTTTGYADDQNFTGQYLSYDVIYDRAQYPKVIPHNWRAADGSVLVQLVNWTPDVAAISCTVLVDYAGLTGGSGISAVAMDYLGATSSVPVSFNATTGKLTIPNVAAKTFMAVKLTKVPLTVPPAATASVNSLTTTVVAGLNSYVTPAYADSYMASSVRGADAWSFLSDDQKAAALITAWRMLERQAWAGTRAGDQNVASVTFVDDGTGYAIGDSLVIAGGIGTPAVVLVTDVDVGGSILGAAIVETGEYSSLPATPHAPTVVSGSGSGAIAVLTFVAQQTAWPRAGVTTLDGVAIDATTFPSVLMQAQVELAFELSQNQALETRRNQDSNIAGVNAGSVGVKFFRPQENQGRFPSVVQELIAPLLGRVGAAPFVTGFGSRSSFDPPPFQPVRGFP